MSTKVPGTAQNAQPGASPSRNQDIISVEGLTSPATEKATAKNAIYDSSQPAKVSQVHINAPFW